MFVSDKRAKAGRVLVVLGVINFALYCIVALSIGGDAFNGHEEGGRYFLANNGRLTEVTRGVFVYSLVHTYSVWGTTPLAMAGWWVSHLWRKRNPVNAST